MQRNIPLKIMNVLKHKPTLIEQTSYKITSY